MNQKNKRKNGKNIKGIENNLENKNNLENDKKQIKEYNLEDEKK